MNALDEVIADLEPISLEELSGAAALLDRVDRKYFVPRELLGTLLREMQGLRVLEIGGARTFLYRTVYFDSPEFTFFRQHVQRRRHRYKVRTRTYTESGTCMLEVKSKGLRGRTLKERRPHDVDRSDALDDSDREYVSSLIGSDGSDLKPVLQTYYHRTTLSLGEQRVTLDTDLDCENDEQKVTGPQDVLVETKSPDGAGDLDRLLLQHGIRPHSVSKYCIGAALLYPHLHHNDWSRLLRRYWPGATRRRQRPATRRTATTRRG